MNIQHSTFSVQRPTRLPSGFGFRCWKLDVGSWMFPNRKARAFTLIELILVMTLLAIVLAIASPALSRFFKGRGLDNEARRFLALTRHAQSRAVGEGVPMVLWFDTKQHA